MNSDEVLWIIFEHEMDDALTVSPHRVLGTNGSSNDLN